MRVEIAEKRRELAALCARFGVTRLELFGSAARETDFDPDRSDLDFLVEFAPGAERPWGAEYTALAEALEHLFGRKVDLVGRGAVDQSRNYIRRRAILKDATPVYG